MYAEKQAAPAIQSISWQTGFDRIPKRPANPGAFPVDDERHWYDLEYSGWRTQRLPIPHALRNGSSGKNVVGLVTGHHPYSDDFCSGMRKAAERSGINLHLISSDWRSPKKFRDVDRGIRLDPDLIIIWIDALNEGSAFIKKIYQSGIPVIAANARPNDEGFQYLLAWTGPDDWSQFRLLARRFAELMRFKGGYTIVSHIEGTPVCYARNWGVITELKKIAPEMELLDMTSTGLDRETSYRQVKRWNRKYGSRLTGIVSADDSVCQLGINQALAEDGRQDVVRVAAGSTPTGIRLLQEGGVDAITYQLPRKDGALSIDVARNWFNGARIPLIHHLPLRILDMGNIGLLLNGNEFILNSDTDELFRHIHSCDIESVHRYFQKVANVFAQDYDAYSTIFRSFSIELFANLHHIVQTSHMDVPRVLGSYEEAYAKLFQRSCIERTISWLEEITIQIVSRSLVKSGNHHKLIDRVMHFVRQNYREPLSLKTLADMFGVSAPHLGKLFSHETGESFPTWLNRFRIDRAVALMQSSDLTIREIAERVGYVHSNYFYKLFKAHVGITAGEFLSQLNRNR